MSIPRSLKWLSTSKKRQFLLKKALTSLTKRLDIYLADLDLVKDFSARNKINERIRLLGIKARRYASTWYDPTTEITPELRILLELFDIKSSDF